MKSRPGISAGVTILVVLTALVPTARAAVTTSWNTNNSGLFGVAANWNMGAPGSTDTAVFNRGTGVSYNVTFPGTTIFQPPLVYTVDRLIIRSNIVGFQRGLGANGPSFVANNASFDPSGRALIVGQQNGDVAVFTPTLPLSAVAATLGDAAGSSGELDLQNGTLSITGNSLSSEFIIGNSGSGTLRITGGAVLRLTASSGADLSAAKAANSSGTILVSGMGSQLFDAADKTGLAIGDGGTGTLTIENGGMVNSYDAQIARNPAAIGTATVDGTGSIWNSGDLQVAEQGAGSLNILHGGEVDSGTAFVGGFGSPAVGTAIVDGAGSVWTLSAGITVGNTAKGLLTVKNGATLQSKVAGIGGFSTGGNMVTVDGAGSRWTNSSDLNVGPANSPTNSGQTNVLQISAGGELNNGQTMYVGNSGTGELHITTGGQATADKAYVGFQSSGKGTAVVDGAASAWTVNTSLAVGQGASGTLNVTNGAHVTSYSGTIGQLSGSTGMVHVDGVGSSWALGADLAIGNDGSGTLNITSGGAVSVSGIAFVAQSGTLTGDGTLHGATVNSGTVAPGAASPVLQLDGIYLQAAVGELKIDIAGPSPVTDVDKLHVSGQVSLAGKLTVTITGGFIPALGSTFDILDWGSLTGMFGTLNLASLAGGYTWDTSQLYTQGKLTVGGVLGDYNHNGVVDAADYTVWRNALGLVGSGLVADGNQNGQVDAADYLVWKNGYGQTAGSGTGIGVNAAVPEPTTLLLLFVGLPPALIRRGRKWSDLIV